MTRSLYLTVALLSLCFNISFSQSWELVCDAPINCPEGFDGVQTNGFGIIPNLTAFEFTTAPWGATGQQTDECARSSNTVTSYLSFRHEELAGDYEYRITVNAKSRFNDKRILFAYGTSPGASGTTNIGDGHLVPVLSPNQPGVDLTSDIFTLPGSGTYYLTLLPRGDGDGNRVFLDNYKLERRLLTQAEVSFSTATSTINEGEELSICIDLMDIGEEVNEQVEIQLSSASSSHFADYITQNITINESIGSQVCVPVQSQYVGQTGTYAFTINTQPGSVLQIGENAVLEVTVNEANLDEVCNWAGPDVQVCQGGVGSLIGNTDQHDENNACWDSGSYCVKWLPEEGLDDPSSVMPLANPPSTTTYTVYVSDNDGNFYGEDQVTVEVLAMPTPVITPSSIAFCGQESIILSVSISGSEDDYEFFWSDADGTSNTDLTITSPGTYSVAVTDPETECNSSTVITVNELNLSAVINATADEICAGATLDLLASVEGASGPFTYLWSNGQVTEGITIDVPTTYEVTITDQPSGCEAYAMFEVGAYEITTEILGAFFVEENTLDDLTLLPDFRSYCVGQSFDLGVGGDFTSIVWSGSDGLQPQGQGQTAIYVPASTTESETVVVTVADANGCTASDEVTFQNAGGESTAVRNYIEDLGFYCFDIEILGEAETFTGSPGRGPNDPCENTDCSEGSDLVCVRDDANLSIKVADNEIADLKGFVHNTLSYFVEEFGYYSARAYISYSEDVCSCTDDQSDYLSAIQENFEAEQLAYWIFITAPTDDESAKMCILTNVPTSEEHNPVNPERREFIDFSMQLAANDGHTGGLANEGEQWTFTVLDGNLDNHASLLGNSDGPGRSVLCEGALQNYPNAIAPSGTPMKLPESTTLSWIFEPQWRLQIVPGCLAGFTDWTDVGEDSGTPKYYQARMYMGYTTPPELPELPLFAGYYQSTTKRDVFVPGTIYESQGPPNSTLDIFFAGTRPSEDEILIRQGRYEGPLTSPMDYPTFGLGDIYETPLNTLFAVPEGESPLLSDVIPLYDFSLPLNPGVLEICDFTLVQVLPDGTDGYIFQLTYQDVSGHENSDYILVIYDQFTGSFDIRKYNCFSGSYDITLSPEDFPPAMFQEITSITIAEAATDVENQSEIPDETFELGEEMCLYLPAPTAAALGLEYERLPPSAGTWPESTTDRLKNYAQANSNITQFFINEIQRVSEDMHDEAKVDIEFVLSADQELVEGELETIPEFPAYFDTPGNVFAHGAMSRLDSHTGGLPDVKFLVHFDKNGGVHTCIRFAEDFFRYTNTVQRDVDGNPIGLITELPLETAKRLQAMSMGKWRDAIVLAGENSLAAAVGDCTVDGNCPGSGPGVAVQRPWAIGIRPEVGELHFSMLCGEISAIGNDFMKDGMLSDRLTYASVPGSNEQIQFIFEAPELGVAFANKMVEINPIAGFYQLATFGYSMFNDAQARQAIINALKEPAKLAQAMYNDKKEAYTGSNKELMLYNAGLDGGAIITFLWTGGLANLANFADKVKGLGKKADDSARKISDELPTEGNFERGDLIGDDHFLTLQEYFSNSGNFSFSEVDIKQFWGYLGQRFPNAVNQKKFMHNPWLAKWWKRNKVDADFCPLIPFYIPEEQFGGIGGGDSFGPGGSGCVDFDDFIKQLPEVPSPEFYARLKQTFPETDEGLALAEEFIKDIKNSSSEFFIRIKQNPDLLRAWEALFIDGILRLDIQSLTWLSNNEFLVDFLKNNTAEAAEILSKRSLAWQGYSFLNVTHQRRMNRQWQRFLEEAGDEAQTQLYKAKFALINKDRLLREEVLSVLQNPSQNVLRELKKANIFHGTRVSIVDGIETVEEFITFSSSDPKLLNKLNVDGVTHIDSKKILARPPNNDSPDRFVKTSMSDVNRSFDAEISMLDDWMRKIYSETGLDWRNPSDRDAIRAMLGQGEYKSFLSPCDSCSSAIAEVLGTDNAIDLVEWGVRFRD